MHPMQHPGQDGADNVVGDGTQLMQHKDRGLVDAVFNRINFEELKGQPAIGHVRNATQDDGDVDNVQPLVFRSLKGSTAIAHNGKIMNAERIPKNLEESGSIFQTTSDTEVLAHLMKKNGASTTEEAIISGLKHLVGAYAFVILTEDKMYVALDPRGIRPLSIGKLGESFVVASETCAFDIIGATLEREVKPGELLTISKEGMTSHGFY